MSPTKQAKGDRGPKTKSVTEWRKPWW